MYKYIYLFCNYSTASRQRTAAAIDLAPAAAEIVFHFIV